MSGLDYATLTARIDSIVSQYGTKGLFSRLGRKLGKANVVFIDNKETEDNLISAQTSTFIMSNKVRFTPMVGDDIQIGNDISHILEVDAYAPAKIAIAYKVTIG